MWWPLRLAATLQQAPRMDSGPQHSETFSGSDLCTIRAPLTVRSHSNSTSLSQNPSVRIEAAHCLLSSPSTSARIHVLASSHHLHTSVPSHRVCKEQPWMGLFLLLPPLTTSLLFSVLKKNSEQAIRSWSDKVTSLYWTFQEEFCAPAQWVHGEVDTGYLPACPSHPLPFQGRWPLHPCVTRSKPWLVEDLALGPYIPTLGHDLCLGTSRKFPSLISRSTCEQRCPCVFPGHSYKVMSPTAPARLLPAGG